MERLSLYESEKNMFHIFDMTKVSKGAVMNWALPSLHGGSLEIMRIFPSFNCNKQHKITLWLYLGRIDFNAQPFFPRT